MSRDYLPRTSNVSQPTLSVIQTSPLCSARMMFPSRKDSWNDLYRICRILITTCNDVLFLIKGKTITIGNNRKFIITKNSFQIFYPRHIVQRFNKSCQILKDKKYFGEYFVTPANTIFLYGDVDVVVINSDSCWPTIVVASCDSLWEMRDISRVVPWFAPRRWKTG